MASWRDETDDGSAAGGGCALALLGSLAAWALIALIAWAIIR